ncbi:hypothetical protein Tco_0130805 [Tanacetum coccineum]
MKCLEASSWCLMKLLMKKLDDFEDKYQAFKRLLDDLRVTAAQIKTAERVSIVKEWIKTAQRKDKDCL